MAIMPSLLKSHRNQAYDAAYQKGPPDGATGRQVSIET